MPISSDFLARRVVREKHLAAPAREAPISAPAKKNCLRGKFLLAFADS
jgi:hypothetical protein